MFLSMKFMPTIIIILKFLFLILQFILDFKNFILFANVEFLKCSSSPETGWTTVNSKMKNDVYQGTKEMSKKISFYFRKYRFSHPVDTFLSVVRIVA